MALCTPACILSLLSDVLLSQLADPGGSAVWRCPYTYESGSRVRLGELDTGARLGYISPHTHEWIPARDTPHTDESDSLEPEPCQTRTCMSTLRHRSEAICWNSGFESCSGHNCSSVVCCVGSDLCNGLITCSQSSTGCEWMSEWVCECLCVWPRNLKSETA